MISQIPRAAIAEHQAAMALGYKMGWKEDENCYENDEDN